MAYYGALSPQPDFSFKFDTDLTPTPTLWSSSSIVNTSGATPTIISDTVKTTGLTKSRSTTTATTKYTRYENFSTSIADDNTAVKKVTIEGWVYFSSASVTAYLGAIYNGLTSSIIFGVQNGRLFLNQTGGTGYLTNNLTSTTAYPLSANTWHHFAFIYDPVTQYKAVYANGICYGYHTAVGGTAWHYANPIGSTSNFIESPWNASIAQTFKVSAVNYYFDTILTQPEIMQRAVYGRTKTGLSNTILANTPTYLTQFDNADKTIDSSSLGTSGSAWGAPDDSATGITVNETGAENKAWKGATTFSTTAVNAISFGSTFKDQFQDLQRSGNYTIEMFVKNNQAATANTISYFSALASGTQLIRIGPTGGNITLNGTTSSGGSLGSLNGTQFGVLQGPIERLKNDGLWHHICLTVSTTGTTWTARWYLDGFFAYNATGSTWTQTSTTPDTPFTDVFLNRMTSATENSATSYDNFAIHSTALTYDQIQSRIQDYYSLTSYGPTVKYYDGTTWQTSSAQKVWNGSAWIDWSASRWDGSSWIAL